MTMTTQALSEQRRVLRQSLKSIERLVFKSAYSDPLFRGTPGEVFRACGKKNCACATDVAKRHGPYRVIQIFRQGKQKQIALKKGDDEIWTRVQHYQQQMKYFFELKKKLNELEQSVKKLIESRIEEGWPHEK